MKKIFFTFFVLINILCFSQTNAFSLDFEEVKYNYKSWDNESRIRRDDWQTTTSQHYNGGKALMSGQENNNKYSCFEVREYFYTSGWIKFHHKESSESGHDYLNFYLNGTYKARWSGITGWTEYSYNVNSGRNTFKWCYTKDSSGSSGDNKVRIDNIRFQGVNCNPTWGNGNWKQIYSCRFRYSAKVYGNINLYDATIDIYSGKNIGLDLANNYIKFIDKDSDNTGTPAIPSKITIPSNSKIDNSTTNRYYERYRYTSGSPQMTSCPAGMHALNTARSNYQGSSVTSVSSSSNRLYCGN